MPAGGQWMTPVGGGEAEWVPDSVLPQAVDSGYYRPLPKGTAVGVTAPGGLQAQVPLEDLERAQATTGAAPTTTAEFRAGERGARIEREHGGAIGALGAGVGAAVDTALLGLPGAALKAVSPQAYRYVKEGQEAHPVATTVGEGAGVVAPAIASAGTGALATAARATPVGALARAGAGIAARGAERGIAARIIASGAGAAVEGAGLGFGEAVKEETESDSPLDLERIASNFSSKMLTGAATMGAVGAGAKAAEIAVGRVGKSIASALKGEGKAPAAAIPDDIARMDMPQLQQAGKAAEAEAAAAQVTAKQAAVKRAADYAEEVQAKNPFLVINEGDAARDLVKTKGTIRKALRDPVGMAERPEGVLKTLRLQETAFKETIERSDQIAAALARAEKKHVAELAADLKGAADPAADVLLKGKIAERYGTFFDKRVTRAMQKEGLPIPRAEAEALYDAMANGSVATARKTALAEIPTLLERNRALQAEIKAATAPLSSARMSAIEDAKEALKAGASRPRSLGEKMIHSATFAGATALASPLGVLAPVLGAAAAEKATGVIFNRLAGATAEQGARTAKAVARFVDTTTKAAAKAPPLATKVLASASFAPATRSVAPAPVPAAPGKSSALLTAFREREAELRSQMLGPQVAPEARAAIHQRLAAVTALSPALSDAIETLQVRKMEFLASKLPRRPDLMTFGADTWQPSDMAMRTFARYVAAVEDPGGVEERLVDGTITPEDAEAYRTVYPERFEDVKRQVMEKLPELRGRLPYQRRLAFSMFTDLPVDPAMAPRILKVLQSQFADEPNTDGGMQAPTAQPAFASVSKDSANAEQTAAQKRAAG